MRKQRAFLLEDPGNISPTQKSSEAMLERRKIQTIQSRLRRGRHRNQPYYRTEQERLEAEARDMSKNEEPFNIEEQLKNYPSKFKISECETLDRTFPACKSQTKVSTELDSFLQLQKTKICPRLSTKPNSLCLARGNTKSDVFMKPQLITQKIISVPSLNNMNQKTPDDLGKVRSIRKKNRRFNIESNAFQKANSQ